MSTAIKQVVTIQPGGLVQLRSPDLHEGDQAEVTVVVKDARPGNGRPSASAGWHRYAGTINSKDSRAADNERIDADLAQDP